MARETEIKSVVLCTLALLAGLCCALMLGCKTSAKVEGGAEIIELKPLETQELTVPNHDYSAICKGCGFTEGTDSWCELHTNPFSHADNPLMISEEHCIAMRQK
jgi:hypothetical protein